MAVNRLRIQVCGLIAVDLDGVRVEDRLPGPQGRRAFAFLVLHRHDTVTRDEFVDAVWGGETSDTTLMALLSRVRKVAPVSVRNGQLRLDLPPDAWVDIEAARGAMHCAESASAQSQWGRAWGAAQTALFTARRGFLPHDPAAWAEAVRHELAVLHERALEAYADAALHVGRTELATAERASRELCTLAPFRESGYRLLMRSLAAQGNSAEALRIYDDLRRRLRNELGIEPSRPTREVYQQILDATD